MPDVNFLSLFANNPVTLSILLVSVLLGIIIWKAKPWNVEGIFAKVKDIESKVDKIIEHDKEQDNSINNIIFETLKQQIRSESLDIQDRIYLLVRYLKLGGNSNTKTYIHLNLIPNNENIWNMACKTMDYKEDLNG